MMFLAVHQKSIDGYHQWWDLLNNNGRTIPNHLWGCNCLYSGIENQQSNISGVLWGRHMGVLSKKTGYCIQVAQIIAIKFWGSLCSNKSTGFRVRYLFEHGDVWMKSKL
jgi:hypothetical protein